MTAFNLLMNIQWIFIIIGALIVIFAFLLEWRGGNLPFEGKVFALLVIGIWFFSTGALVVVLDWIFLGISPVG